MGNIAAVHEHAVGDCAVASLVDVVRYPVRDGGLGYGLPVGHLCSLFTGGVGWIDERQFIWCRGGDDSGCTVDDTGAHIAAIKGERVGDGQVGGVAQVHFDETGELTPLARRDQSAEWAGVSVFYVRAVGDKGWFRGGHDQ